MTMPDVSGLPENIDDSYIDDASNPGRKAHQQAHDLIHKAVKALLPRAEASATYVPRLENSDGTTTGPSVGLDLRRAGSGTGSDNKATIFNLEVTADTISQQTGEGGATGSKVNGLNVIHQFGGATAKGGRHAIEGNLLHFDGATATDNADRNYVGVVGQFIGIVNDRGTSIADYKGAAFGGNFYAELRNDATFWGNLTGAEFNTYIGSGATERVAYASGIQIASKHEKRGFLYDCGIGISGVSAAHLGFKDAILIGNMNGGAALAADSNVMRIINIATLTNGLDWRSTTFSGSILKTSTVDLKTSSLALNGLNLTAGATNHNIEVGRADGTASTPYMDWHSGATAVDYDVRLIATGGTGVAGQGTFSVQCGTFSIPNTNLIDAANITVGSTTGTRIGTATTQKLGFYNKTPVTQRTVTAAATDAATTMSLANSLRTALVDLGLVA